MNTKIIITILILAGLIRLGLFTGYDGFAALFFTIILGVMIHSILEGIQHAIEQEVKNVR